MNIRIVKSWLLLAAAGLLAVGIVGLNPAVGIAQSQPDPAFELEDAPPPPLPPPGLEPRPSGKGLRVHLEAGPHRRDRLGEDGDEDPGRRGRRFEEALERMKTENPERYRRIERIRGLADDYRSADDAKERQKIEKELKPLLDQELKAIQADNERKIEELQRRLEEERRKQREREMNWDAYVNFQFNRITGEDDYLHLPFGPWR